MTKGSKSPCPFFYKLCQRGHPHIFEECENSVGLLFSSGGLRFCLECGFTYRCELGDFLSEHKEHLATYSHLHKSKLQIMSELPLWTVTTIKKRRVESSPSFNQDDDLLETTVPTPTPAEFTFVNEDLPREEVHTYRMEEVPPYPRDELGISVRGGASLKDYLFQEIGALEDTNSSLRALVAQLRAEVETTKGQLASKDAELVATNHLVVELETKLVTCEREKMALLAEAATSHEKKRQEQAQLHAQELQTLRDELAEVKDETAYQKEFALENARKYRRLLDETKQRSGVSTGYKPLYIGVSLTDLPKALSAEGAACARADSAQQKVRSLKSRLLQSELKSQELEKRNRAYQMAEQKRRAEKLKKADIDA